jgi:hypothetical protein
MTPDQRDHLLDLHRKAVNMMASGDISAFTVADDAFRDYLMSLPVT